jgi:hypothetical protein
MYRAYTHTYIRYYFLVNPCFAQCLRHFDHFEDPKKRLIMAILRPFNLDRTFKNVLKLGSFPSSETF